MILLYQFLESNLINKIHRDHSEMRRCTSNILIVFRNYNKSILKSDLIMNLITLNFLIP